MRNFFFLGALPSYFTWPFNVPASIGLSKYYEFILRKIDGLDMLNPTEKELEEIEQEEKTESILSQLPKGDVTIH